MKTSPYFLFVFPICFFINQQIYSQIKEFNLSVLQPPVEQCISTGTNQNTISSLKIYPNPSHGAICIEYERIMAGMPISLQISAPDGRIVYAKEKQNTEGNIFENIDISRLPKGIYIFQLKEDYNCVYDRIILY
jgi:hypothetical protein